MSEPDTDTVVTSIRLQRPVHAWLKERADYYGSSVNSELIRLLRSAMDSEGKSRRSEHERAVGKDRAIASPE
jgi:hypothetical protein